MQSFGEMQSMATNIFSAYASVAASMMLFRSMATDIIPEPVKSYFHSTLNHSFKHIFGRFFVKLSTHMTLVVEEWSGITRNQIYDAAEIYLRTKVDPNAERLVANKSHKQKNISVRMERDQRIIDYFKGFELKWQFVLVEPKEEKGRNQQEQRFFELTFDKLNKDIVVDEYLPFVLAKAKEIKDNERAVKLYTRDCPYYDDDNDGGNYGGWYWGCINLDHPVTFDKLAMNPNLKRAVIEDLDRFVRRRNYYREVGKAWKRGYLLYGPPGTGKSSLVAAMANYLRFDVYDLELTSVYSNSELRRLLLCTNNRSIIVVEDVDCSVQMRNRDKNAEQDDQNSHTKLTLSGFLNFIDGLWSSCGDERIIIFTTNHKDKLDPALLRPGRMDVHIEMGYCTPEGFDILAFNYLGIRDHANFLPEIKGLIQEVEITPAEIAEHLMRNEDVELALEGVLDLLKRKKQEKSGILVVEKCDQSQEKKRNFGKVVKDLTKLRKQPSRGNKRKRR